MYFFSRKQAGNGKSAFSETNRLILGETGLQKNGGGIYYRFKPCFPYIFP